MLEESVRTEFLSGDPSVASWLTRRFNEPGHHEEERYAGVNVREIEEYNVHL
jgi:hypothetical protein